METPPKVDKRSRDDSEMSLAGTCMGAQHRGQA